MRIRGLLVVLFLLALAAPAQAAGGASPGAAGIGDRLFPELGNGGYDVLHYDLDLRYATSAPSQPIDGTVTIFARATQSLSRFNLDFAGKSLGGVTVDGARAGWRRDGQELVVTPRRPLRKNGLFVVRVSHFVAVPTEPGDDTASTAFFIHADGSATAGQPDAEHYVFPSNDHPRDKATFTFRFDVPAGTTAVANGAAARALDAQGAHDVAVRGAPSDGDRADPAGGREPELLLTGPAPGHPAARRRAAFARGRDPAAPRDRPVADRLDGGPRGALPARRHGLARHPRGPRLRARDAGDLAARHLLVRGPAGRLRRRDAAARAVAHVVRRQRRALQLERHLAQRGPRQLVRVRVLRGAGLPRRRHRRLPRSGGLRHGRRSDARRLPAQRPVAPRLGPGRPPDRLRPPVRPAGLPRRARSSCTPCARWWARARSSASSARG